jgi:hypothetical protein
LLAEIKHPWRPNRRRHAKIFSGSRQISSRLLDEIQSIHSSAREDEMPNKIDIVRKAHGTPSVGGAGGESLQTRRRQAPRIESNRKAFQ